MSGFKCTIVFFTMLLFAVHSSLSQDWSSQYLNRPQDSLSVHYVETCIKSSTRKVINLNGKFQAKKDNHNRWVSVSVPGAYRFEDRVEFRRNFRIDSSLYNYAFKIKILGINNKFTIFINKQFVATFEGASLPVEIPIQRDFLNFNQLNEILVVVDNRTDARYGLPLKHRPKLLYNYGGIIRDIFILALPNLHIDSINTFLDFLENYKKCRLKISTSIKRSYFTPEIKKSDQIRLKLELFSPENQKPVAHLSLPVKLNDSTVLIDTLLSLQEFNWWDPNSPRLYNLRAQLYFNGHLQDEINRKLGIGEFKISGTQIIFNGKPFQIKGISWYEDFPQIGQAVSLKTLREELQVIKDLGANTVRVVGLPPHPYFLDACDEIGLLVFLEGPLYAIPENRFADEKFERIALHYYENLLNMALQHISVAAVGFGYELEPQKTRTREFLVKLKHLLDKTTTKINYLVTRQNIGMPKSLIQLYYLDLFNLEPQNIDEWLNTWQKNNPDIATIIGTGYPWLNKVTVNDESGINDIKLVKDKVQASKMVIAMQKTKLLQNNGIFIQDFADWHGAKPGLVDGVPSNLIHPTGIYTIDRKKRLVNDVVRAKFHNEKLPEFGEIDLDEDNPIVFPLAGLGCILFFLFNFNRNRRLRQNLKRIFIYPHGFYMDLLEYRKMPLWDTFVLNLAISVILSITFSSLAFRFRNNQIFDEILSLILIKPSIKIFAIWLVWHPFAAIVILGLLLNLAVLILVVLMRVAAFIMDKKLTIQQIFTTVFWASASLIWLLPFTPIYYRIINKPDWQHMGEWMVTLFFIWWIIRLFRAVKIVFNLSYVKTFIFILVLSIILGGGISWFYDSRMALFDYLPYYWQQIKI